jgi:hypothetical protein
MKLSSRLLLLMFLSCVGTQLGNARPGIDSLQEQMRREDYFNRIDRKLINDIGSTRVWKLRIDAAGFPLASIPIQADSAFKIADPGTNELLFVVNEENYGDSSSFVVIPLAIRRTVRGVADTSAGGGITKSEAETREEISLAVHLKDFARLDSVRQEKIVRYIIENTALATPELDIRPESKPLLSISPFNRDFWSLAKATSAHMIPFLENATDRRGRRPGTGGVGGSKQPVPSTPLALVNLRDSVVKDSVDTRFTAAWPAVDGVSQYRITVDTTHDFKSPIINTTTRDTILSITSGLTEGRQYYFRVQNEDVPSSPALAISMFSTKRKPASPNEGARVSGPSNRLGYSLDFSLSRITFAHELLYSEKALGIPGFGVEVNFDNPILGLLPYKSPAMTWGGRLLLNTTGDKKDVLDRDFLELKLMARTRFDCQKFYDGMGALRYLFTPLASSESPQLNVAAPGFAVEVATSRWWNLPYLNFYVSTGSEEYSDPVFSKGEGKDKYAYWSTSQWRGSMSFYFNLDSEPDFYLADAPRKRLNIVRLDIGAGTYNVARVGYDTAGNMASKVGVIKTSRIQPYLSVEYVHASQLKTSFGIRSAYFDNRIFLSAWLSLFKIGYHELRLEGTNILGPFGRAKYEWEASGGTMLQFRYRLGF